MPIFRYKVRNKHGNSSTGIMEVLDKNDVAKKLTDLGFTPVLIEEIHELPGGKLIKKFRFGKLKTLGTFTRQLASLIKSGVPILRSMQTLEKQSKNNYFREALREVMKEIENGAPLSMAMQHQPAVFNELYTNTVKAGETGGTLDESLNRLADLIDHEIDTRSKILGVMLYPAIATVFLFIGFIILTTFVVPQFVKIFASFKGTLPLPTRILIGANYILKEYWYIIIFTITAIIAGFLHFIKTAKGRKMWDKFRLKVPLFGPLILKLTMSRFSRIVAILTRSGVPILSVLDMAGKTTGNMVISEAIDNIRDNVKEGKSMAEPMQISGVFSPMVVQMISIGEETGRIDELLFEVSEYYDREAAYSIKNLSTLIEPVLIVVLAVGVLVMALGIFLPMWNMMNLLTAG